MQLALAFTDFVLTSYDDDVWQRNKSLHNSCTSKVKYEMIRMIFFVCFQLHVLSNIDLILCCVYVCCAAFALSPSFYFCLHSSSFVCSTSSVPRQVFSIYVLGPVCLCFCPNVCAAWARRACLHCEAATIRGEREDWAEEKEQPGKYKQTQQQLRPNYEGDYVRPQLLPHQTKT